MSALDLVHLTAADARRVPWKNGRGVTEELALWPAGASFERGDFDGRISRAAVVPSGAFSSFPGYERVLVVIDGDGLTLTHGDVVPRARVRRLEPYRFSGDWPTSAELVRGPVSDFNVLVRRGGARAEVEVVRLGRRATREALGCSQAFVHMLAGSATARVTGAEEVYTLAARESLWARGLRAGDELELVGATDDSVAILVRIAK